MSLLLIFIAIIGSLIAILPAVLVFFYIARFKGRLWVSAFIGGVFWLIALLARTPILLALELWGLSISPTFYAFYTAILIFLGGFMAGLFEEGIKYGFLKKYPKFIETVKHTVCFGLGWGLCEAILIYVLTVLAYGFLYDLLIVILPPGSLPSESILIFNFILGAIERNSAIVFHVSATILVALAVWHRRVIYALVAILAHFFFDFIPLIFLQFIFFPFLGMFIGYIVVECLVAVFVIGFVGLAYWFWRRDGGPSVINDKPEREAQSK